ncbi:fibronectin type III domain-containing protein [Chitinophaga cymbidii]|uniref:Staphylococcus aureus surface protein A n=1 Tax=Chitinophaga cymbidii TaxID=1096750 RepID=A0A512RRM4_9BACT|nr:fibronectin type III domain-containing protein [Chitinophaga cymbidii]GEP98351.1 hypothetical protein CCY01nite_46110 [Chitinophaga cymbidii]
MKQFYLLLKLFLLLSVHTAWAQVLDPNDPVVVYNPAAPPTEPVYGQIGKWVKTNRVNWNTSSYKAYIYKGMQFRLKWPANYDPNKKYPMIIFFHGLGEKGSKYDNEYQLYHGGQTHMNKVDNGSFDGFLFYPQNTSGYFGPSFSNAIDELINNFFRPQLNVDPYHIIAEGLSAGGTATWDFMVTKPKLVAALGPISAANGNLTNSINTWKYTPIWWFQGGSDPNPAPAIAQGVYDNAVNAGANIKLTIYPGQGHGVWGLAWGESDFFPFAMRAYKSNPWPLFGRTEFCPGDPVNVTLGLTAGFNQYEWRKDGEIISGATSNTYTATSFGSYDARIYNGTVWSDWSHTPVVIKLKDPTVSPDIAVSGLMSNVLPTPAGSDSVVLEIPTGYSSYLWKKTSDPATLSTTNKLTVRQPGDYVVKVTEQFGCSSDFSAPFKVIDASGANGPDALTSLIATTMGRTQIVLNWSDKPNPANNETFFEVYRSNAAESGYKLIAKVNADVLTYTDNGLSANTAYYYKVRPVNNNGAATVGAAVTATTLADGTPPTAPGNLTITGVSRNTVALSWTASYDEVGVDKYEIYINGIRAYTINGDQTSFLAASLNYRQVYSFVVKAKDATGNTSIASNQVSAATVNSGLNYKFYTGTWSTLPDFNTLTPVKTGNTPTADISVRTQNDRFAFLWEGYINIPVTGNYTFETYSDDGSKLYIGQYSHTATAVVNNDGAHGNQYREGTIHLTAGAHPIAITYFEATGGENMQVYWKNTAHGVTNRQLIPAQYFVDTITLPDTAPVAPTAINVQAVSHNKLNVSWTDNSSNESGFEVYRSATSNGAYSIVATVGANTASFTDSALNPQTTYYYRVRAINNYGNSGFALTEYDGLKYDYYEATSYTSLPDFNAITPKKSGTVATVDITPRDRNTQFAMKFEGWIYLPTAGNYTFYTTSDAGSKLYIDGFTNNELVVSNDHLSGSVEKSGTRNLTAGYHKLIVTYFEATGSRSLAARYAGPGISKQVIPASALLNPYIKGTTLAAPTTPAAPSALEGSALSPSVIRMKWADNAGNETAYEVYRSTAVNTTYALLKSLPANAGDTAVFIDSTVSANITYYYKVRAANEGGNSAYSNEVAITAGNNAPEIVELNNRGMRYETTLEVQVSASDEDGDALTLTASNVPAFATFTDNGDGTGKFTFSPGTTNLGTYAGITVTANDGHNGSAATSFTLTVDDNFQPVLGNVSGISLAENTADTIHMTVTDQNAGDIITWTATGLPAFATLVSDGNTAYISLAPGYTDNGVYNVTVKVDDGKGGEDAKTFALNVTDVDPNFKLQINFNEAAWQSAAQWNNLNKKPVQGDVFANLLDVQNQNTGMSLSIETPWQNINNTYNTNNFGYSTGNNSGIYPDVVTASNWFTQNAIQVMKLSGVDTNYQYTFTFFGSRNGIGDNRLSIYRLNDTASATLNTSNNQSTTVTLHNIRANANGEIKMELAPVTEYAYLASVVIQATYYDGKAPAKAGDLHASVLPAGVKLSWTDRAFNEDGYRIFRSAAASEFSLLATVNANDTVYTDADVTGNTTYRYFIETFNTSGSSLSDTISTTLPNRAPLLNAIADVSMKTDSVVTIQLSATDDTSDVITLTASNLPSFAVLHDNGDGTGTLTLSPGSSHTGKFDITVTASDNNGLQSDRTFSVQVADKNMTAIYVNFNRTYPVATPWNSFNSLPSAGANISNLKDGLGNSTGATITIVDAMTGDNEFGAVTGDNTGVFPDDVMRTAFYDQTATSKRIRISNLNAAYKYNLVFFGSRGQVADNRNTTYSVGAQSVTLNAASNTSNTVQLNGISPDGSGNIEFSIVRASGSTYAYLNAMVIQSYIDNGIPLSPDNLSISGNAQTSLKLTWADKASNETGYEIYRSASRNGTYALIQTVAANTTTYTDAGLSSNTIYYYKVRAVADTLYSDYSNIASGGTLAYAAYFNFNTANPAPSPWNNTNTLPYEGQTMTNPLDATGSPVSFSWTIEQGFTGTNPAGVQTGNNSGVFPDLVLAESYYVETGDTARMRFYGLDQSKEYSFTFMASRNGGGSRITHYLIGGKSTTLDANNNSTNTATIENLVPDENGELLLTLYAQATYGYLNALVIKSYPREVTAGPNGLIARTRGGQEQQALVISDMNVKEDHAAATPEPGVTVEKVFPNPFSSFFNLSMHLGQAGKIVVNMFDISGRLVLVKDLGNLPQGYYQQRIDAPAGTGKGIYLLQVTIDGKPAKTVKLIRTN